ncbi:MAG: arginine--tRNA ligase [Oscillospiraceae bacterium]|nr:arginine--tRNA ligase [Oscillospiraceae bacterium]
MSNLIEAAKKEISALIGAAYEAACDKGTLPAGTELGGTVEIPKDPSLGDYACSCAMTAAKSMRMPPRKIAEALIDCLSLEGSIFRSAEAAGAGFINFRLSDEWYGRVLADVEKEGSDYGRIDEGRGQRVMVEFVSANPTGTMTIGNARGGVLGDAMASVLEKAGYDVWREFYVNDAGHQVEMFARSVEARYIQMLRGENACEFPEDGYHGEDIKEIAKLFYEKYGDAYLNGDEEKRRGDMMRFGIEYNIEKMRRDLERYGIKYDLWFRESSLHESGYVAETVELLSKAGYTYEKDGALWFELTRFGAEKDEVLRRSNGFYTYYAVDMAYHRNKFIERGFDKVINVWGADHHGHALRFHKSLPALGIDPDRLHFLIMQLVRLMRDGETVKVSKRTGKAIALSDLLDEIPKDAARFFFNAKPDTHLDFDMDLAVRRDSENPVYYVQYAHARICSLCRNMAQEGVPVIPASETDASLLDSDVEHELIKQIALLPEEIRLAARDYDPSRINRYLIELASRFHRFYGAKRIQGEQRAVAEARLKLADCVRIAAANALAILGVDAPDRM